MQHSRNRRGPGNLQQEKDTSSQTEELKSEKEQKNVEGRSLV